MQTRIVAILIDGGFFLRRISKLLPEEHRNTPENIARSISWLCGNHIKKLMGNLDREPTSKSKKVDWM